MNNATVACDKGYPYNNGNIIAKGILATIG